MKRIRHWGVRAVLLLAPLSCLFTPCSPAQVNGVIHGQVLNTEGKPWVGLVVQTVNEQGQKREVKTDSQGDYSIRPLPLGKYTVNFMIPNQAQPYQISTFVGAEEDKAIDVNFKDVVARAGGASAEQSKKQQEEKQKFEGMKAHFDAGVLQLEQARQLRDTLAKTPAAQRDPIKQQVADLSKQAVGEFEEAQKAAPEKDTNMPTILARLADAYDMAGRTNDAIVAYQQAIALKPVAGYYINVGNLLARAGKIEEAHAAYMKTIEIDPASAAQAWRNFGFVLYNANRLSDAVEPLQKAVELDPKNAQAWYCLGASLLNNMKTKTVGDTMQVELAPGTVEAYQKAVELDPNGIFGQQAKQGLEAIEQMAPGIQTKYGVKKKKS
jgi:tetratricopeptide (TPR) repeat protein